MAALGFQQVFLQLKQLQKQSPLLSSHSTVPSVPGNSLAHISQSLIKSDSIISDTGGGLIEGIGDIVGQCLLPSQVRSASTHSGILGGNIHNSSNFSGLINQHIPVSTPANVV